MTHEEVTKVTVSERVKMVEYPEESYGKLFIVYSAEGYYENAVYLFPTGESVSGNKLICFTKDPDQKKMILEEKEECQDDLRNPYVKAVESVSPFSVTVLKTESYCNVIPGSRGPIYICIPPGTPC